MGEGGIGIIDFVG